MNKILRLTRERSLYQLWWLEILLDTWGIWLPSQIRKPSTAGENLWFWTIVPKAIALLGIALSWLSGSSLCLIVLSHLFGAFLLWREDYGCEPCRLFLALTWGLWTGALLRVFIPGS